MASSVVLFVFQLLVTLNFVCKIGDGTGYNLKELKGSKYKDPGMATDDKMLDLIKYAVGLEADTQSQSIQDNKHQMTSTLRDHMVSEDEQSERILPQWIVKYVDSDKDYPAISKTLIVFIPGTEQKSPWDWKNGVNIVPFPIQITLRDGKSTKKNIEVHGGDYEAVNNEQFVKSLWKDLYDLVNANDVEQILLSGHSQGGSIATMAGIEWKGKATAAGDTVPFFRKYFLEQIEKAKPAEMNPDHNKKIIAFEGVLDKLIVFTFGSFGIVAHDNAADVDKEYHAEIFNFIHPIDPVPMMNMATTNKKPTKPIGPAKGLVAWIIGQEHAQEKM